MINVAWPWVMCRSIIIPTSQIVNTRWTMKTPVSASKRFDLSRQERRSSLTIMATGTIANRYGLILNKKSPLSPELVEGGTYFNQFYLLEFYLGSYFSARVCLSVDVEII